MNPTSGQPDVVHLVREANGRDPFERFLDSYRCHDAGAAHRLVLLFKGFADEASARPYRELAGGLDAEALFVDDSGFDLTAYLVAASRLSAASYCFLNSFSVVLADGWLAKLHAALSQPGVGLVGATGSWGSSFSYLMYDLRLPSGYRAVYPDRGRTRTGFRRLDQVRREGEALRLGVVGRKWRTARDMAALAAGFPPFPAHHVRTNGFMIDAATLAALDTSPLRTKTHAYRLESGRRSITRQVEQAGLKALVVGRDGVAYPTADWPESETFWQASQSNLIVDDNQTQQYSGGDPELRDLLSRYAWGERARRSSAR